MPRAKEPNGKQSPLSELRRIREAQRRAKALRAKRDSLIRQAIAEGYPHRMVAEAAGLAHSRINQIVHSG